MIDINLPLPPQTDLMALIKKFRHSIIGLLLVTVTIITVVSIRQVQKSQHNQEQTAALLACIDEQADNCDLKGNHKHIYALITNNQIKTADYVPSSNQMLNEIYDLKFNNNVIAANLLPNASAINMLKAELAIGELMAEDTAKANQLINELLAIGLPTAQQQRLSIWQKSMQQRPTVQKSTKSTNLLQSIEPVTNNDAPK